MARNPLFITLVLSSVLWLLNEAAYAYSLFWMWWWYDIPMHFLGGMVVASFTLWFVGAAEKSVPSFSKVPTTALVMCAVLVAGFFWEVYEYFYGIYFNPLFGYPFDTIKDFIMAFAGAGAVLVWFSHMKLLPVRSL